MFRLVKVLNANNQCEVMNLKFSASTTIGPGCALACSSGTLTATTNTSMPDFISVTGNNVPGKTIDAIFVTEDMVFKVEYTGTNTPHPGMSVGLSTKKYKMDAVTSNSSGRGIILAVDDDPKLVYVRFRK